MPRFIYEYSNEMLFFAARDADAHDVHQERLIREIMVVDEVEYDRAAEAMREIFRYNIDQSRYLMVPFQAGLALCAVSGVLSVPLVFNYSAATAFASYVGASPEAPIPPGAVAADIGTWTYAGVSGKFRPWPVRLAGRKAPHSEGLVPRAAHRLTSRSVSRAIGAPPGRFCCANFSVVPPLVSPTSSAASSTRDSCLSLATTRSSSSAPKG